MGNFTVVLSNEVKLTNQIEKILKGDNELLNISISTFSDSLKRLIIRHIHDRFWSGKPQVVIDLLSDLNFIEEVKEINLIKKENVVKVHDVTDLIDFVSLNNRADLLRSKYLLNENIPVVFYINNN